MADKPTIIVRRVKKIQHAGHHGGAWKVAYADFITAMMAFFLVMWLVGAASTQQRAAISEYFKNPSPLVGTSQAPTPGMNGPGGASSSMIRLGGTMELPREPADELSRSRADAQSLDRHRRQERQRLEALRQQLQEAIGKSQALAPFKDQLLLQLTPDGLRIQIVDQQNRPMFDLGSARLRDYTDKILRELAGFVNQVPNHISITGHTDITAYGTTAGYSNWELSADRANAARRALIAGGMAEGKVARVVGLASSILFDRLDPKNPINRRISIVVMTLDAEEAAVANSGASLALGAPLPDADIRAPDPAVTAAAGASQSRISSRAQIAAAAALAEAAKAAGKPAVSAAIQP